VTLMVALLIPVLVLAIVAVFVFAGCTLIAPLDEHHAAGTESYSDTVTNHSNLLHYWRLGENPSTGQAKDIGAIPRWGTYTGGGLTSVSGVLSVEAIDRSDMCVRFNGSTDYVAVANFPALNPPFTIEAWIRPDFVTAMGSVVLGSYETQPDRGYRLRVHRISQQPVVVRAEIRIADAGAAAGPRFQMAFGDLVEDPLHDGWHHLVATFNPPNMALFVDGTAVGAAQVSSYAGVQSATPFRIGAGRDESTPPLPDAPPDAFFQGRVDEVALYGGAYTDVADHYHLAFPR
jgi:Concanavalin A-like lectin/glucanases superfamily